MHVSVLLEESLAPLLGIQGKLYVDCTLGGGGHTAWLLEKLPEARIIAFDKDESMIAKAKERFREQIGAGRLVLLHRDYGQIQESLRELGLKGVDGLIADLGVSSFQLDLAERGFSFMRKGPLDMRMDQSATLTAREIVNHWPQAELERIFFEYGEERWSKKIVRKLLEQRSQEEISDTQTLAHLVESVVPREKGRARAFHPATRVFQALRIAVNDELGNLEKLLAAIPDILNPGGAAAIISFHSLEDRLVKQRFRYLSMDCICPPPIMTCERCHKPPGHLATSKPIVPTEAEETANPRARSAKLRIFFKNTV